MSISEFALLVVGIAFPIWCLYEAVVWLVAIWRQAPTPTDRVHAFLQSHPDEEFGGIDIMEVAGVSGGMVYVALGELQRQGLVESHWEALPAGVARQRRRFYRAVKERHVAE